MAKRNYNEIKNFVLNAVKNNQISYEPCDNKYNEKHLHRIKIYFKKGVKFENVIYDDIRSIYTSNEYLYNYCDSNKFNDNIEYDTKFQGFRDDKFYINDEMIEDIVKNMIQYFIEIEDYEIDNMNKKEEFLNLQETLKDNTYKYTVNRSDIEASTIHFVSTAEEIEWNKEGWHLWIVLNLDDELKYYFPKDGCAMIQTAVGNWGNDYHFLTKAEINGFIFNSNFNKF